MLTTGCVETASGWRVRRRGKRSWCVVDDSKQRGGPNRGKSSQWNCDAWGNTPTNAAAINLDRRLFSSEAETRSLRCISPLSPRRIIHVCGVEGMPNGGRRTRCDSRVAGGEGYEASLTWVRLSDREDFRFAVRFCPGRRNARALSQFNLARLN
ncbi:hypothetical protein GWI33_017658 [Rhynchophorus ferrugineus]|uniref:Uncharacterized protein n=1 Tax=Rhynchophorus ferrugineus TaxID=354439 RepID=A0A834HY67_RHYFE|nr:hypothetical protein GWI33_017658 [Rhynchophorus ferrugineus]